MKKTTQFSVAGILFTLMLLASCAKEEEPEPTTPTPTFRGHWSISEVSSQTGSASYPLDIADSSNTSYILFSYLYGYHTKIYASVSGSSFAIPSQIVEGNSVSGGGTLTNANQINMYYWVNQGGGNIDTLTAVLTK